MIDWQRLRGLLFRHFSETQTLQADFAKDAGIATSTLSRFLSGTDLSAESFARVCLGLGVSMDAFIEGEEGMNSRMLQLASKIRGAGHEDIANCVEEVFNNEAT